MTSETLRWNDLTEQQQRSVMRSQGLRERISEGYMESWEITWGLYKKRGTGFLYTEPVTTH